MTVRCGIHFDPANCIFIARLFYDNAAFFEESFRLFGNEIESIHLKDIALRPDPFCTVFDEVPSAPADSIMSHCCDL